MTVHERLKDMSSDAAGLFLCGQFLQKGMTCNVCPVQTLCSLGSCGFSRFLEQQETMTKEGKKYERVAS